MRRELSKVTLHSTVFIPGGPGQIGPSLPHPTKTIAGFKMFLVEGGLEIVGMGVEAFVPITNVQIAIFAKEEPKKA